VPSEAVFVPELQRQAKTSCKEIDVSKPGQNLVAI